MSVSGDLSAQIINQAWTKAESLGSALQSRLDTAQSAVSGSVSVGMASVTPLSDIAEPSILIPYEATGPDLTIFNEFNQQIMDDLVVLFGDYLAEHFPMDAATLSLTETKLQAILNGGVGLDAGIEAQIWERDRSRILADATRSVDEVASIWAAKGFPIPPGPLQHQTLQIQQKAQDELAKSSREVAIKSFEIEVGLLQFAIKAALELRQVAVSAAGDFIKAIASGQDIGYKLSMGKSQAQNGLISATASFLNARTNAKDTVFKSAMVNADFVNQAHQTSAKLSTSLLEKKADIAVAAADTVGRQAAAMLNNLHTSVGVQGREDI